jgi:hypothetical protein
MSTEKWKNIRSDKPMEKWKNAHYFDKFNAVINKYASEFDGSIKYYPSPGIRIDSKTNPKNRLLEYSENSPMFNLFKLSPNGYYIYNYNQLDLWKKHDIDHNIIEFLNDKNTNKYNQNNKIYEFDEEFILFPLQSLYVRFDANIFIRCVIWAEKNKKYIIFKKHPFSVADDHIDKVWKHLQQKGIIKQYAKLITHEYNLDKLIDAAKMVWCFSSGAGTQALLKRKPLSFFSWDIKGRVRPFVDYAPIAHLSNGPEDAYSNKNINEEDLKRYFSWYYHKLVIDLDNNDYEQKIYNRMYDFYVKDKTIEEIF